MQFPMLPKKKAYAISNGVFLILLGLLFYTGQWWPGILFVIGATFAIRQYLIGHRIEFLITLILIALLGIFSLTGHATSLLFPFGLIVLGLCLIIKELVQSPFLKQDSDVSNDQEKKNDESI